MKSLFTILISVTFFFSLSAQEANNFKIEHGSLIWQQVYETTLPANDIIKYLKSAGVVRNIELSENIATGTIDMPINYKSAGYSEMNIPMYIPRNNIVCTATIEFKEGRYRVTLKNLNLKATMEDPMTKIGEISPLETFALKKKNSVFREAFFKTPNTIYNYTFSQVFEMKNSNNDNW